MPAKLRLYINTYCVIYIHLQNSCGVSQKRFAIHTILTATMWKTARKFYTLLYLVQLNKLPVHRNKRVDKRFIYRKTSVLSPSLGWPSAQSAWIKVKIKKILITNSKTNHEQSLKNHKKKRQQLLKWKTASSQLQKLFDEIWEWKLNANFCQLMLFMQNVQWMNHDC